MCVVGEKIEDNFLPVIDSGATVCITGDEDLFPTGLQRGRPARVRLADGRCILVTQRGTMCFNVNGKRAEFNDTLFHPSINKTLLSLSKLTAAGNNLTFTKDAFSVRNNSTGRATIKGGICRGKYTVANATRLIKQDPQTVRPRNNSSGGVTRMTTLTLKNESVLATDGKGLSEADKLHQRLGHAHPETIRELLDSGAVTGVNLSKKRSFLFVRRVHWERV